MSIKNIIGNWNSDLPNSRPYLITNQIVNYYNKMPYTNLTNLYNIDKVFNNFCWYIDNKKGTIYNINLYIDNVLIEFNNGSKKGSDVDILEELNAKTYIKLNVYLSTLKRSDVSNKFKIISDIIIHIKESEGSPEYFKISEIKSEEIPINNKQLKRKRKNTIDETTDEQVINKKKKSNDDVIDWSTMISASSTRNFFLNDPLIDWLKEYNITSINDVPVMKKGNSTGIVKYEIEDPFTKFIMEQGNIFEEKIINIIMKLHPVIKVAESYESRNPLLFKKTIEYMKQGKPIIYQGILHNYKNKTYGAPDLMIRSDYLNKFIGYDLYNDKSTSPKLNVNWHYVIVDIKHSKITLNSDGIHIRNQDSIPAYKGQLLVYTQALNEIQGTNTMKAFIMGKKYEYECKKVRFEINDLLNKLGTIDYAEFDKIYVSKLNEAIEWIKSVRQEGNTWKLLPIPSKDELFPNMKNDRDGAIGKVKKELATEIHEITSITYCGVDKRKTAFAAGIYGWNDERCTTKNLGFSEGKISKRIDGILNINRQSDILVAPSKINYNTLEWRTRKPNEMEFFLDYETMNSNFGRISVEKTVEYENFNFIFMVGIGYTNKNNEWEYKSFIAEEKTKSSEKLMLDNFWKFVNEKVKEYGKEESIFIHWSQAEKIAYGKSQGRHLNLPEKKLLDLYEVFINEPITVKGALDYSLKSITKAMYKYNLISTIWDSLSPCANGLNAMLLAHQCYDTNKKVSDMNTMKEIEKYNEIDCKSMWDILKYLRTNH